MSVVPKYAQKPIIVISGVGSGTGTGNATAREFGRNGYRVALIARHAGSLTAAADEINGWPEGEAAAFPIAEYNKAEIHRVFAEIKKTWPGSEIRVAVYNTGHRVAKPFLDLTQYDIDQSIQTNIYGGFAFAQEAILSFREYEINELGYRGALIFTSATSAWRGNPHFAAFAAGKHGVRALSQSLNKEFGKQNIHVAHCIVDGTIKTKITTRIFGNPEWEKNPDVRLDPVSIAKAYWYLAHQDRTAWTWELDLRPAHENW
ncbi:hypothetical protein BS47DRAFT_1375801 [Hydnum rufescens UP504]|uniref:NAD(P)-binding protein n=1 Tax=Hydnum rufescens UP504 TaxID=1448309 RepID=A0A9P6B3P6_9AGAM|nr:hypothetical protein BS47DRAFT_1375801 [Hydnum rufescens UP504]